MAQYDAGTSVGKYLLQADQAIRTQKELIANYQTLAKAASVRPPPITVGGGGAANVNAQALAQQKLATETQRTAAAQNQAARAAQALATEQNRTAKEAANTAAAQDRAAKSALSLAAAQQRAANVPKGGGGGPALPRTFAGFTPDGFNQALGAFGLATFGPQLVGQAVGAGVDAAGAALALRETKNSLRAVAGDLATYTQTVQAAREQQRLFGGTLQDNIEGLSGLTITARSSGASLQSLIGLSQRLAVLDPAQGAAGARIALNEALSGDPTSLAKRYEIPRAALQKLRDTTLPVEERLKVIDAFLSKVGITAESVAGRVDQDALAFRTLNAELEAAKINAGDQLASAFSGAATGLARLVGVVNGNPEAIAQILALRAFGGTGVVGPADVDRQTRNLRAADVIDAEQGARDSAFARDKLNGTTVNTQVLDVAKNALVSLGSSSDEARDRVIALYTEFGHTGNLKAFIDGVRQAETANTRGSRAARETVDAFAALRAEMQASAQAAQLDTAQKDAQQATTALLAEKTRLSVDQFLALNPTIDASAASSLAAAQGYDPQIRKLIELGVEARNAQRDLAALQGGGVTEGRAERDTPQQLAQARTAGLQLVRDQAAARDAAERDRLNRTGTTQQKLRQAEKDLAAASTPQARFEAETKVLELRQQAAREAEKGDRSRVSAAEKALSLEERIRDSKEKQLKATLDAAAAAIKDRQDRRKEDQEIRQAQRILGSGRASQAFKDAAADRIALIGIERQQRALDIAEKQATAGGAIVNGRVIQSIQGGAPVAVGPVTTQAGRAQAQAGAPAPTGGGAGTPIQFLVDGKVVAEVIVPFVVADLHGGLRQAQSAGA